MLDVPFAVSAFIAGILMILAPCTLPILPAFVGFLAGLGSQETSSPEGRRWRSVSRAFFFVLGFSIVFVTLGTGVSVLGQTLRTYQAIIQKISGTLIILLGLLLLGVFNVPFLEQEKRILSFPRSIQRFGKLSSLIMGASFGFGWSPCVGPILASVLFLAANVETATQGALLLAIFSLGLAIPFLLVAFMLENAFLFIQNYSWFLKGVSFISGSFLVVLGVLIFTNRFLLLIKWGFSIFRFIHYDRLLDYL